MKKFEFPRLALDTHSWKWLDRGISHLGKRLTKPLTSVYGNGYRCNLILLPRRNWHPFGKILASDVLWAFALNPPSRQERPPLKIFASCLILGVNFWNRIVYHVLCFFSLCTGYHRVSPGITRPGYFLRACGAPITRPGGRATLSCPPGPRLAIAKSW